MPLKLVDLERIAREIAGQMDQRLKVVAAMSSEGASDYAEILLALEATSDTALSLIVGVTRNASESTIRQFIKAALANQLGALPVV